MIRALRRPLLATATAAVAAAATALIAPAAPAVAGSPQSEQSVTQGFRKAVTVAGIEEHLRAFQSHADAHGSTRSGGSPGFEASASYVKQRMQAAGYVVKDDFFDFVYNADRTPAVFSQVAPASVAYVDGVDFSSMTFSPNGDVTAPVHAVDLVVPAPGAANGNTSGCEAGDFAGFPAGAIALVQRGTCPFAQKSGNAAAAGAAAVIVFNEGQNGRTGAIAGTLSTPQSNGVPVIGTTFAIGDDLRNGVQNGATGSTARVRVDRVNETRTTRNVIAETPGGVANDVVLVGAHLDSVPRGAGINDNGTGSAGILEIAEQLAARGFDTRNKVRFAWWSAEEFGLVGSTSYVNRLTQAEKDAIALNLNFDMIGSPNYVRFVYDGDNSAFPVGPGAAAGPTGSGEIERVFRDYFVAAGLTSGETPFSGRSDYGPFIAQGIPAGGLFTGAEGIKTPGQASVYGGQANVAYDPCYHLFCDDIRNVNRKGLDEMSDAAAHATLTFARRDFAKEPFVALAAPVRGTDGVTPSGGGLHEDHEHDHEGDAE